MKKKEIRSSDEGYSRHWSSTARICPFLVLILWQMVLRGAYWNHLLSIYFLEQHIFIFTVNNLMTAHNPGHSFLLIALSSGRATGIFWGTDTEEQCICQILLQKNTFGSYGVSIFASGQITRCSCRTGFGKHNYCRTQNSSTEPQQWKRHPGTEEVNTKTVTSKMPYVDFLTDRLETDFGKSSNVPAQEHCSDTSSPGWKRGRQLRRVLPGWIRHGKEEALKLAGMGRVWQLAAWMHPCTAIPSPWGEPPHLGAWAIASRRGCAVILNKHTLHISEVKDFIIPWMFPKR